MCAMETIPRRSGGGGGPRWPASAEPPGDASTRPAEMRLIGKNAK